MIGQNPMKARYLCMAIFDPEATTVLTDSLKVATMCIKDGAYIVVDTHHSVIMQESAEPLTIPVVSEPRDKG